jgi:hypothetical protein
MQRLEFSREWLKNYHAKKETRHADGAAMARNIRRTGVAVTIKGKPTAAYPSLDGPTAERLAKADNHYAVGDDKRGNVSTISTTAPWTACIAV